MLDPHEEMVIRPLFAALRFKKRNSVRSDSGHGGFLCYLMPVPCSLEDISFHGNCGISGCSPLLDFHEHLLLWSMACD